MNLKKLARRGAHLILGAIPIALARRVLQAWLSSVARRPPRMAMRALLEIDEDISDALNRAALRYDGGVHVKHRLTRYHDFFVERIGPGERVLDIGCGYGAVAYSVATRAGAVVTGIDLSRANIAQAGQRYQHPGLTFICGDALQALPTAAFETIVFSNVLEHIEERVDFLTRVQQRIQPRRWLIRVPMINRHWTVPMRQELGLFFYSDPTHYTEYTQQSFEAEMHAAEMAIRHVQINWGELWAEVQHQSIESNEVRSI